MTCVTSRSNGAMPVVTSHRPKSLARWTSSAGPFGLEPGQDVERDNGLRDAAAPEVGDGTIEDRLRAVRRHLSKKPTQMLNKRSGGPQTRAS